MRDKLHLFYSVSQTEEMAVRAGSTGVYIVPAFVGLGAPSWDERARAVIVGLTFSTGTDELVRAALESMAFQVKDVLDAMEADSGIPIQILKVDGGAAANNFLLQKQADLCRMEVDRFEINELTALGAAYLAGLACGFWNWDDLNIEVERSFVPQDNQKEMEREYLRWLDALHTCRTF
ncbi:FGGY-family carbohydrate kinase [Allobaculum sp. Allo2]